MNRQNGKGNPQFYVNAYFRSDVKKLPFVFNYGRYYIKMA